MGLGLILGKALGGLVGGGSGKLLASAIGGAFGQKIDDRSALKKEWANEANSYIRMAEAARRAGLNPLEVLRAGNPNQVGRIAVGTSAAMQNQFDRIDDILTGEHARQQKRDAIEAELAQVELDTAKAQLAAFRKPAVGVRSNAYVTDKVAEPNVGMADGARLGAFNRVPYTPTTTDASAAETFLPPGHYVTEDTEEPAESILKPKILPSGRTVFVPEDLDEAAVAFAVGGVQALVEKIAPDGTYDDKDLAVLRANIKKNHPEMSEKQISELITSLTKGYTRK